MRILGRGGNKSAAPQIIRLGVTDPPFLRAEAGRAIIQHLRQLVLRQYRVVFCPIVTCGTGNSGKRGRQLWFTQLSLPLRLGYLPPPPGAMSASQPGLPHLLRVFRLEIRALFGNQLRHCSLSRRRPPAPARPRRAPSSPLPFLHSDRRRAADTTTPAGDRGSG